MFRFGLRRKGLFGERPQHSVLSFFDTAGEDFNSRESVELNTRYLTNADGIILLLDPLQMPAPGTARHPVRRCPARTASTRRSTS